MRSWGFVLLALCLSSAAPTKIVSAGSSELAQTKAYCPPIPIAEGKLNDYRGRDSTPFQEWSYKDNWRAHTWPAIQRIRAGDVSRPVMADLSFTLHGWPNHVHALKALVDYKLAGGKSYDFPPIECFFAHAQRNFPDDVTAFAVEGFYYTKLQEFTLAEQAYRQALIVDEDSIDVHYSLGLLYVETGDYDSALQQAWKAYGGGYPLPGLRRKLEQSGHWQDPSAVAAPQ